MRFIDGMTRAGDFHRVAVRPCVVPLLKIGIDDLIGQRDDSPTGFRCPRSRGQRRVENLSRGEDLGARLKYGLVVRQVGGEEFGEVRGVEIGEAIVGLFDGPLRLGQDTRRFLSQGALVLPNIGCVRGDVDQADDMRVDACLRDDGPAVAVANKDAWARLEVEDPLRCGDVRLELSFRLLYHGHVVTILDQDFVDGPPPRAVDPGAVHQDDILNRGRQRRRCSKAERGQSGSC